MHRRFTDLFMLSESKVPSAKAFASRECPTAFLLPRLPSTTPKQRLARRVTCRCPAGPCWSWRWLAPAGWRGRHSPSDSSAGIAQHSKEVATGATGDKAVPNRMRVTKPCVEHEEHNARRIGQAAGDQ